MLAFKKFAIRYSLLVTRYSLLLLLLVGCAIGQMVVAAPDLIRGSPPPFQAEELLPAELTPAVRKDVPEVPDAEGEETKETPEEKEAVEVKPEEKSPEGALYELALNLYNKGLFDQAASEYKKLLDTFSGGELNDAAQMGRGDSAFALNKFDEAAEHYRLLVNTYPDSSSRDEAQIKLGRSLARAGKIKEAIDKLLRIPTDYPQGTWADNAILEAGNLFRQEGDARAALATFHHVIREYKQGDVIDQAFYQVGMIYENDVDLRDFQKASISYGKVLEIKDSPWWNSAREHKEYIDANLLYYE